jgi:hypothetical protein
MPDYFRILFFQLIAYLVFHEVAKGIIFFQKMNSLPQNNHWVYNILMLIEGGMLLFAAGNYFSTRRARINTSLVFLFFFTIYLSELRIKGLHLFANYSYAIECIAISMVYIVILFEQFERHHLYWYRAPLVYACVGILVYFICCVPYITLMAYFQEKNPHLNQMLFNLVHTFSNVRYLLLAIAFWHLKRNVTSFQSQFNG